MSNSFKFEDNYRKKKNNKKNNNLVLIIISVAILFIIVLMLISFINSNREKIVSIKVNKSRPYVYTIINNENDKDDEFEVPAINLVGDKYSKLNKLIMNNYESVAKNGEYSYQYKYNVSKTFLSLVINYAYYENNNVKRNYESIVIDLNKDKVLTKEDILKKYKVNEKDINKYIESKFRQIYTDVIEKGYYTSSECDYNCFLNNRNITTNYIDNMAYCIENGSLVGYKNFKFESDYGEEDYFFEDDHRFVIKE